MKYDIDHESIELLEDGHKEILQSECYEDNVYFSYIRKLSTVNFQLSSK